MFTRSPTEGHLGIFQVLATRNKAAINIHVRGFCEDVSFSVPWINIKEQACWVMWLKYVSFWKDLPNCLPEQLCGFASNPPPLPTPGR